MHATLHRRSTALVASILLMVSLVAAQEAPVNVEAMRPGEIIIRPTGKKVRVVKVAPAAQSGPTTQPSAAATLASATTKVTVRSDDGSEYTERSVRLPLGYDPAENYAGGYGPVLNLPLDTGYYPEPYFGGILGGYGYGGGYGYRHSYGYSDCGPLIGFGGGRGYGYGSGHSTGGWSGVGRSSSAVWIPSGVSSSSGGGGRGGSSFSSSGGHSGGGRSGGGRSR